MASTKMTVLFAALVAMSATKCVLTSSGGRADNNENSQSTECRDALLGEYPWMVALYFSGRFTCSAFLVTPEFVMTAAHCFALKIQSNDPKLYKGYIGTTNRGGPDTEVRFKEIYLHPGYTGGFEEKDIALLKLARPLTLSDNIRTICLSSEGFNLENMTAHLMGWTVGIKGERDHLQTVTLKILTNSVCADILTNFRLGDAEKHICASSDSCFISSGSPLVTIIGNKPVAIGITSFGSVSENTGSSIPIVFTNTSTYIDWIMESTGNGAKDLCFVGETSTTIRRWGSISQKIFYMSM